MTQYEHYELKSIDAEIAELERKISVKNEQRREIINRKDLNKVNIEVKDIEDIFEVAVHDAIRRNFISAVCGGS